MNYTVFDVETANKQRDSICSIGIIRYENEQVIYEKELLINPEVEFNYYNIRIHGIKESDVIDAPKFPVVWNEIGKYFDETILVAHNAKSMDLCALYRTLDRYNLPMVNNAYICTLELAKEIFKDDDSVDCYKLNVLSKMYDIDLMHHHNALEDTKACFEILRKFESLYPEVVSPQSYYFSGVASDYSCVAGHAMEGIMDDAESRQLFNLLDAFINPKTQNVEIDFSDKTICLSGDFNSGSKKQVEELLIKKGAIMMKSVTSNLDVLILGQAGSAAWKYGNYGSKYEKAQQLNEKRKNIVIVKEEDIFGS